MIPDLMFERERLRSQIKKWKWLFFIALTLFAIALNRNTAKKEFKKDYIARVNINGVMEHNPSLIKKLKEIEKNSKVKALIVHVDSPGGTSFAGEELYVTLKKISKTKPIVSVLETVAASGGYMVALASDHIVARNMTITGSIGVIWQSFEAVEFANKLGVKFLSLKSSPLKASPNPTEPTTPEAKEAVMESINDSFEVFLKMLMDSRKMTKEQALKLADGKVYTGKRAKELKLIDEIGGEDEALKWLESNKKIPSNLPLEDIDWTEKTGLLDEIAKFLHKSSYAMLQGWINNMALAR